MTEKEFVEKLVREALRSGVQMTVEKGVEVMNELARLDTALPQDVLRCIVASLYMTYCKNSVTDPKEYFHTFCQDFAEAIWKFEDPEYNKATEHNKMAEENLRRLRKAKEG